MIKKLSPRDWELLSAYLDRQLKPNEVVKLETRLSADPDLSAALGELQRTRDALRSLPKLHAPRNFTLTPQMVGQRAAWRPRPAARLAPVFGFASAVATLILVLVVVGDLLGILAPASQNVAQAPLGAAEVASQQAPSATLEEAPAAPMLGAAPQPTQTVESDEQILQSQLAITETAPVSPELGETAPFAQMVETTPPLTETETAPFAQMVETTPPLIETETTPLSTTSKLATGMGGGGPGEAGTDLLPSESINTDDGPMWVTTLLVTVSPTETLSFPMTITLDGKSFTGTLDLSAENSIQLEATLEPEPEPTLTATPEPTTAPVEAPAPAATSLPATSTPAAVASLSETPTTSLPEPQILQPEPLQSATEPASAFSSRPVRSGLRGVRILEVALAFVALAAGLAAAITWWSKRG